MRLSSPLEPYLLRTSDSVLASFEGLGFSVKAGLGGSGFRELAAPQLDNTLPHVKVG